MFNRIQRAVSSRIANFGDEYTGYDVLLMPEHVLPERYSLEQLYCELAPDKDDNILVRLAVLELCLQNQERIIRQAEDLRYAQDLLVWLSRFIQPTGDLFIQDELPDGDVPEKKNLALRESRSRSRFVLKGVQYLSEHFIPPKQKIDPAVLLGLIAYTDTQDPWTSVLAKQVAEKLLERYKGQLVSHEFITGFVLVGFIRPLFSSLKPAAVTLQGRKALNPQLKGPYHPDNLDPANKPWKFRVVTAVTAFQWAIKNMNEDMIYESWHLCVPPILILLDDSLARIRVRGLDIFSNLLSKTPAKVLQQTGIGEVFEDAVMPTLNFLPNLTPVEESLKLLRPAYAVLIGLAEVRFSSKEGRLKKISFFDKIMRQGVLQGFSHSGENVRIAELLLEEMTSLTQHMGIYSVKHLKDMVPILSIKLTDPFATSHPGLLLAALKATQGVITNCWPRMTEPTYRIELIKALIVCWTLIHEDSELITSGELTAIEKELKISGLMLVSSVDGKVDISLELKPLVKTYPWLEVLFGMNLDTSQ